LRVSGGYHGFPRQRRIVGGLYPIDGGIPEKDRGTMDETRNGGSFPFPILGKNKDRNEKSLQHGVYLMAQEHRTGKGATKHTPIVSCYIRTTSRIQNNL